MFEPLQPLDDRVLVGDEFIPEKTNDLFKAVTFKYGDYVWNGAVPKIGENQGLSFTDEELSEYIPEFYDHLNPKNRVRWIVESDARWRDKESQTYKVLNALYSGEWECRVHGPIPQVNPQAAARIRDLKVRGYIIASRRLKCEVCDGSRMHDLLVMLPPFGDRFTHGNELRKPISGKLKKRIMTVLGHEDVCFGVKRDPKSLIIDHKFPSQRWDTPESDNPDNMSEKQIAQKFQLLGNQTNMLKSRYCDRCVKEGIRGDFMGMKWFYQGDERWPSERKDDEAGCVGCPWYDLSEWKKQLINRVNSGDGV